MYPVAEARFLQPDPPRKLAFQQLDPFRNYRSNSPLPKAIKKLPGANPGVSVLIQLSDSLYKAKYFFDYARRQAAEERSLHYVSEHRRPRSQRSRIGKRQAYIIPPIPPPMPAAAIAAGSGSLGMSTIPASVVRRRLEAEAAF